MVNKTAQTRQPYFFVLPHKKKHQNKYTMVEADSAAILTGVLITAIVLFLINVIVQACRCSGMKGDMGFFPLGGSRNVWTLWGTPSYMEVGDKGRMDTKNQLHDTILSDIPINLGSTNRLPTSETLIDVNQSRDFKLGHSSVPMGLDVRGEVQNDGVMRQCPALDVTCGNQPVELGASRSCPITDPYCQDLGGPRVNCPPDKPCCSNSLWQWPGEDPLQQVCPVTNNQMDVAPRPELVGAPPKFGNFLMNRTRASTPAEEVRDNRLGAAVSPFPNPPKGKQIERRMLPQVGETQHALVLPGRTVKYQQQDVVDNFTQRVGL